MFEARDIEFSWGRGRLLDGVAFSVETGTVAALAGANGAGKTTLLRILAGLIEPPRGWVAAGGKDTRAMPMRYRRQLGWMAENAPLEPDMRVKDFLKYRALLKGEMKKKIRHRVKEALSTCGLEGVAEARIEALSHGMRKRAALAEAILLRPRYLLLDDPMGGVDGPGREAVVRILEAAKAYSTVIASGHELEELEGAADKFLVLKGGRIVEAKTAAGARTVISGLAEKEAGRGE